MIGELAVITINIDPELKLGPLTLAWHGAMIAAGILAGAWLAARYADRRGLDRDRLFTAVWIIALAGLVGARLFFLLEDDAGALLRPDEWLGSRGFAFYGAMILGTLAVGIYLRRQELGIRYLDALAFGFPLGMAIGRVGDLINGEHYGPASDLPWAVRNSHPRADVPSPDVAYHSGGLYEIVLALLMLPLVWWLSTRLRRPGMLLWAVVAIYGAGRFLMFFYRSDSDDLALGLNGAQWTSLAMIAAAGVGALISARSARAGAAAAPD